MKFKTTVVAASTARRQVAIPIALTLLVLASNLLHAQITVTSSVFPAEGDTLFFAIDPGPQIVITPPGGPQQWDFSSLNPSTTWEQIMKAPQTGAGAAFFPEATLVYDPKGHFPVRHFPGSNGVEAYLKVTANTVTLLGYYGGDPIGLGLDLVSIYNPPIVLSRAPVNFFDIQQVSSGLLLPFSPDLLPPDVVSQLPFTADSLRIRISLTRLDVVDAYGSLTIPGGTFNVLREKRTQILDSRLDANIPPLGWLDVTDLAIQYLGLTTLGSDTIVTYRFVNDQSKEPIAICATDDSGLTVTSVQFKNLAPPDADGDGVPDNLDVCPGGDDNLDADGDGVPDACDACPLDATKSDPGVCGCGVPDTDTDGDYLADCIDSCPTSDLRATVWVGDCDSGVSNDIGGNPVNTDGCSLADEVAEILSSAASGARNHGQFVSRTARALNALVYDGTITWAEHQALMSCVGAAEKSQF